VVFRYDDSFVRICDSCRNAVLRTDRGIESLGKVADLLPSSSPLELFLEGRYNDAGGPAVPGGRGLGFLLIGHAQLRHGAGGTWDEWYAKFDDSRWGWIAEAQGRIYVTFEMLGAQLPAYEDLEPGGTITLQDGGPRTFTIGERGEAEYLACEGEIPYRFVPGRRFRFADLADGQGRFATIDYGSPDQPRAPVLFLGRQVTLADLGWAKRAPRERPAAATVQASRLACPQCDGSIELRVPDQSMRVACPYCDALLDNSSGAFAVLKKLKATERQRPPIALGSKATFDDVTYTLVGFVRRHAVFSYQKFPFDEYLLYAPAVGFRWLVESDGHWSFVTTLPPGAVQGTSADMNVTYRGTSFRVYQRCPLEVASVWGELYWRVEIGETVYGHDYVAPPAMLSCEEGANEVNWSLSGYRTPAEVAKAFGLKKSELPGPPEGIAPNQPHHRRGTGTVSMLALAAVALLGIARCKTAENKQVAIESFEVVDPADPRYDLPLVSLEAPVDRSLEGTLVDGAAQVFFTEPFELAGNKNVEINLSAPLDNEWMFVGVDLVNVDSGAFVMAELDLDKWSGYTDGESWTEGADSGSVHFGAQAAGTYVVRLEVQRGTASGQRRNTSLSPYLPGRALTVEIRQDVFRWLHFGGAAGLIALPALLFGLLTWRYERLRWKHSDFAPAGLGSSEDDE
jgi:hypothetical protein